MRILRPDEKTFDSLDWNSIESDEIQDTINGCTVVGAETSTDGEQMCGASIYLQRPDKTIFALECSAGLVDVDDDLFYLMKAEMPEDAKFTD